MLNNEHDLAKIIVKFRVSIQQKILMTCATVPILVTPTCTCITKYTGPREQEQTATAATY